MRLIGATSLLLGLVVMTACPGLGPCSNGGGAGPPVPGVTQTADGKVISRGLGFDLATVGAASIAVREDRAFIDVSAAGDGVRIALDGPDGCAALGDILLEDTSPGDWIRFGWWVRASDNVEFELLESTWVHTTSTTYTTIKKDRSGSRLQVRVTISDATVARFKPFRVAFDRRTRGGVEQVQLEFRDPSTNRVKKLFPWGDPSPTQNVSLEVTTSGVDFSFAALAEAPDHVDSMLPEFGPEEFRDLTPDEIELLGHDGETTF